MSPAGWKPPALAVTTAPCRPSGHRTKRHPRGAAAPRRSHTPCSCSSALPGWLPISAAHRLLPSSFRRPAPRSCPVPARSCPCRASGGLGQLRRGAAARSQLCWRQSRAAAPAEAAAAPPPPSHRPRSRPGWAGTRGSAGDTQRPPRELQRSGPAAAPAGSDVPAPPAAEPPGPATAQPGPGATSGEL